MLRRALGWLAALVLAGPVTAQADADDTMRAVPLAPGEVLRLTGRLDHPAWQRAPVYDRFTEHVPVFGAAPLQATRVQLLFDSRALYVGITVRDSAPEQIRGPLVRHDQVNRTQDFVVVYIDAIGTRRSAQFFRVNAAGSTGDGLHTAADDSEDFTPDFDWDAATSRQADGWTAVLRLPFASLRYAEGEQSQWRIMVARRLPRENFHLLTSVPLPRDAPSFIDRLQPLAGVELPREHGFVTLRPSVTLRRLHDAPADGLRRNDHAVETTLDVKWRPRAELVVDATLNPDFSQVELDVPQLAGNTRFALSFPEKRPFFFESADLLRTPTEAFYTRSFTEPRWGLRATWRGSALAGSAFAVDDRGGGLVLLPGPFETGVARQPASRTLAARGRWDAGDRAWGGALSLRRYEGDRGDNVVLGPDLGWRLTDAWRLRAQWLHARTTALGDGNGGLRQGDAVDGDRVYLRLHRLVDMGETVLTLDDTSEGFRHDSGFVNQAGIRRFTLFASTGWRPAPPFNEAWINVNATRATDRRSGAVVEQALFPGFYVAGAHNLEWWVEWHGLAELRPRAGGPLLHQNFLASGLVVTPALWFPLLDTTLNVGRLADTVAERVRPGLRWTTSARLRPLARLELEPSGSLAWLREDGQRRYEESTLQVLAVWHLGPRSHLRAIWQGVRLDRQAEPGVLAFSDRQQTLSLTWSWRASAGTVLYVGASHAREGRDTVSRSSEAFVKLQVDFDDARVWWGSGS